jgi:tetratricopeptide (TPR) repeat protein
MNQHRVRIPLILTIVIVAQYAKTVDGSTGNTGSGLSINQSKLPNRTIAYNKVDSDVPTKDIADNAYATTNNTPPKINFMQRPPFLKHITNEQIQEAIRIADERHQIAVQRALSAYPVWQQQTKFSNTSNKTEFKVNLKEYPLQDTGGFNCLPDYGNDIPTTVFVTDPPLLTVEECRTVIANAEDYFTKSNSGKWTRQQSGQYEVSGFDIYEIPAVKEWFLNVAQQKLLPLLQQTFSNFCGGTESTIDLCIDNAYLFKYTPETGRRTDIHTDSGCLSFTIALSPTSDYDGGGTWFHGLQQNKLDDNSDCIEDAIKDNILSMEIGQITIRPGGVKHCGYSVTRGTRYIIGGFCIHRKRPEYVRMLLQPDNSISDQQQLKLLETAIVLNPGCTASYNILANYYLQRGNTTMAQQLLDYCLQNVDPLSGEVAYALASLNLERNDYIKALQYVSICLQVDPHDVEALMMAAMISSKIGDRKKEEDYYHSIVNISDAKPSIKASAYCNLGVLYQGEDIEIEYYRHSLNYKPINFSATYSLASALASRKQWIESIELFKKSLTDLLEAKNENNVNEYDENRSKALRSLYSATMYLIKEKLEREPTTLTPNDMIQRFHDNMGEENFKALQNQK